MRKSILNIILSMESFNKFISSSLFLLVLCGCQLKKKQIPIKDTFPDIYSFKSFYTEFHIDSIYQLHHIRFPLEGQPDQSDTTVYKEAFHWMPDQWVMHHTFNEADTAFDRSFRQIDSTLIIEQIKHLPSTLSMERRWSRNDTAWELIYYSPLRTPVNIEIH